MNNTSEPTTDEPVIFSPLVANVLSSMIGQNADLSTSIIDRLTEQLAWANAQYAAIETDVGALLSGDFMPTPSRIMEALYPTKARIREFLPAGGE